MTRREKIIEILNSWISEPEDSPDCIMKWNFDKVADEIAAIELDIPIGLDCEVWIDHDRNNLIDNEVFTKSELDQRLLGRVEGLKWMESEILKRNL